MNTVYRFEDCELDLAQYELRRGGAVVHVEPQVLDVLAHLVANHGRLVPKTELLDGVWSDRFVSESALTSRLKQARRAVGDDGQNQRVIATVHGRGYRFVAPVVEIGDAGEPSGAMPSSIADDQEIRYGISDDGVCVAYAIAGSGPPLVKAANWFTNLELEWNSPIWSHWLHDLASGHQLIRYDERGCGLSDWDVADFSFDAWVDDLELVVDAVGVERFPLLGISQGGAVAIAYAVRHPERVERLILCGAYSRGRLVRAETAEALEEAALDLEVARVGWRRDDDTFRQVFASQFLPDAQPRAVGGVQQPAAGNDVDRQRRQIPRCVRPYRRVPPRPQSPVSDIDRPLPGRCPGAGVAGPRVGSADPGQSPGSAQQPQSHPHQERTGLAGVPRRGGAVRQ